MFIKQKRVFKKIKRCIIGVFMTLVMVCTMLPTIVHAADQKSTPTRTTTLDVSGMKETTDKLDSEGWKWVPRSDGGTLTLKNCYIQSEFSEVLRLPENNVTIMLEGENTLETLSTAYNVVIDTDDSNPGNTSNLTFDAKGNGKLNILRSDTSQTKLPPYAIGGNSVKIIAGDIYANMEFCTLRSDVTMLGGSLTVDATNIENGMAITSVNGNVNIAGGKLDIKTDYIGIYIQDLPREGEKKVSLTGGDVKIRAGGAGIFAKKISIDTTGNIDIQGDSSAALYCSGTGAIDILSAASLVLTGNRVHYPETSNSDFTITIANANYASVDKLISEANALNPDDFTTDLTNVKKAVNAVIRDKKVLEQNIVNGYATAIKNEINTLKYKGADYSKVDVAISKIPSDLSIYTDASVKAVNDAKNAVNRDKNITEQELVDHYAKDIEHAIKNLTKKTAVTITSPESGIKIEKEDGSAFDDGMMLEVKAMPKLEMDKFKATLNKVAPGFILKELYDISLMKDGVVVQPDSKVKVSIPLTDELKAMVDLQVVSIDDKGAITIIPSKVKDDVITFTSDHFSYYGVIGKVKPAPDTIQKPDKTTPATGDHTQLTFYVIIALLSVSSLLVITNKRKAR